MDSLLKDLAEAWVVAGGAPGVHGSRRGAIIVLATAIRPIERGQKPRGKGPASPHRSRSNLLPDKQLS